MQQGDIYWANLDPVKGFEQAGDRPVLVVQKTTLNAKLNTVMIVPITTNLQARGFLLTHVLLPTNSGLPKESVALLFQIRTLDKRRLTKKAGQVSTKELAKIREKLFYAL